MVRPSSKLVRKRLPLFGIMLSQVHGAERHHEIAETFAALLEIRKLVERRTRGDSSTTGDSVPEASASCDAWRTATSSVPLMSCLTRLPSVVAKSAAASPIR